MMPKKIIRIFPMFFLAIIILTYIFQHNTEKSNTVYEDTIVTENIGYDPSITEYNIQETITQENVFEVEFIKLATSLLDVEKSDIVFEKDCDTQYRITIDKSLTEREYAIIYGLLKSLKISYYSDDFFTIILELPNEEKEIVLPKSDETIQNSENEVVYVPIVSVDDSLSD